MASKIDHYPNKVSATLVVFVTVVLGGVTFLMAYQKIWIGVGIVSVIALFTYIILFSTSYRIVGNELQIVSLWFFKQSIPIRSINAIRATIDSSSSADSSFERLAIIYNKNKRVLVSPAHHSGFVKHLIQINPEIKLGKKLAV